MSITTCIPVLSWIGAHCWTSAVWRGAGLDIAWMSELDPAWLDDELSFLLNPEAALFANLPAQAACAADCAAASTGLSVDSLFWCAGCQGGMYPATGNVQAHVGGVQASLLAAQRFLYLLHRRGIALGTSGSRALCGRYRMPVMKKITIPVADDAAGAGDFARRGLQPHGAHYGAVGVPQGTARVRGEFRVPALEKTQRAACCECAGGET